MITSPQIIGILLFCIALHFGIHVITFPNFWAESLQNTRDKIMSINLIVFIVELILLPIVAGIRLISK